MEHQPILFLPLYQPIDQLPGSILPECLESYENLRFTLYLGTYTLFQLVNDGCAC